jgi:hypothetical protein
MSLASGGRVAYSNTGSDSVTGLGVHGNGLLERIDDGRTGETGAGSAPIDSAVTDDGLRLYVLTSMLGTIAGFSVADDGTLTSISTTSRPLKIGALATKRLTNLMT